MYYEASGIGNIGALLGKKKKREKKAIKCHLAKITLQLDLSELLSEVI